MGLPFKPHTVTIHAPDLTTVGSTTGPAHWPGDGDERMVQITPMSASAVFDRLGVEVSRPHLLMDDDDAAEFYVPNAKVTMDGRTFFVVGAPEVYTGIKTAGSHLSVVLREDK